MTTHARDVQVDQTGVHLSADDDIVLDVLFDGRRVWSFWTHRDTTASARGRRTAAWPKPLHRHLDGIAEIAVREHAADGDLFCGDVRFGSSDEPIEIVNARGKPLGIDKSGKLVMTFETRTAAQVEPLLDSVQVVLDALADAGIEGFLAYGTLLGAVREGALLGHDSDADLGYVSRHTAPVDVIRESFRIQRTLARNGLEVVRYSGGGLKVMVQEADGSRRGLDVFTGFFDGSGRLVLMGEVRTAFEPEWIWPLTTATLEGHEFPVPAEPAHLLEAMYGPHWRTPDPAFQFETPESTTQRLNDWFRGIGTTRSDWDRKYAAGVRRQPNLVPHQLARDLLRAERGRDPLVVDVGCGRGEDAFWLAGKGLRTWGLDYSASGYRYLADRSGDLPLRFASLNLLETRQAMGYAARIAAEGGRRVVLGRHVADALPPRGRQNLWRLLRMACGDGGAAYLDFLVSPAEGDRWAQQHLLCSLDPDAVIAQLESSGATVVRRQELRTPDMRVNLAEDPRRDARRACRLVVEWP